MNINSVPEPYRGLNLPDGVRLGLWARISSALAPFFADGWRRRRLSRCLPDEFARLGKGAADALYRAGINPQTAHAHARAPAGSTHFFSRAVTAAEHRRHALPRYACHCDASAGRTVCMPMLLADLSAVAMRGCQLACGRWQGMALLPAGD